MTDAARLIAEDAAARQLALDGNSSFIVQAPAGSGKTELLIQRYLKLLSRADVPEEIVAITFTRKAAAEMKSRVFAALEQAAQDRPPTSPHKQLTWTLARHVRQRDETQQWQLMLHPGRLRVQTIDAFCAYLTARMPVLSSFGAAPRVTEHAEPLYRDAARSLLKTLIEAPKGLPAMDELLLHLDDQIGAAEHLLVQMLARRDQWLPLIADPTHPGLQRKTLETALAGCITHVLHHAKQTIPPDLEDELVALAVYAGRTVADTSPDSPLIACIDLQELPPTTPSGSSAWKGIAHMLMRRDGQLRKQPNSTLFPTKNDSCRPTERTNGESYRQRYARLMKTLRNRPAVATTMREVNRLPDARYDELQWSALQSVLELLPVTAAALKLVFRQERTVDFTEIAHGALAALGDPDNPTDLALVLDHRIRHVLVDEFQDTSYGQYELLKRLTAGWQADDGRTLFLVGDPMQSIYRFRDAEVGLYLRARQEGIGQVGLQPLRLFLNFRAQRALVDWSNDNLPRVFPAQDDLALGAVGFSPAQAANEALPQCAVSVHARIDPGSRDEARLVGELIAAAQAEHPNGTTAILVRSRSHLVEILETLRTSNIAFQAIEIEHLGERPVVQDLLALTRALLHLGDRVAWLAILRAPWCGLTLHDLHALSANQPRTPIWDLLNTAACLQNLSQDGRERVECFVSILQEVLKERGRAGLRRWVEGCWFAIGGPGCVQQDNELLDAEAYFQLLDQLDDGGELTTWDALQEGLQQLYAGPDNAAPSTLQIMTIHKAKGLEFDTVIVPGLERSVPETDEVLLRWTEYPDVKGNPQVILGARGGRGSTDDLFEYLRHVEKQRNQEENLRLLYVAVTRARRRVHLIGSLQTTARGLAKPRANSLLARLWPILQPQFEEAAQEKDLFEVTTKREVQLSQGLRRVTSPWQVLPAPAAVLETPRQVGRTPVEFLWATPAAAHIGTIVHRLLQQIATDGWSFWTGADRSRFVRHSLHALGIPSEQIHAAVARVVDAIDRTHQDPRGRWILDRSHREAASEMGLSGWIGNELVQGIIDRSFVDQEDIRWVIDYKTGRHEGSGLDGFLDTEVTRYRPQMNRYAQLMSVWDDRPLRLGLYFPLHSAWREWRP